MRALRQGHTRRVPVVAYGCAVAALVAVSIALASIVTAGPHDSHGRESYARRVETVTGDSSNAALGRGRLKVINDSGQPIALRIAGPAAAITRIALIAPWTDHVFGDLVQGRWRARYCLGEDWQPGLNRFAYTGECDELTEPLVFSESLEEGRRRHAVAVMRFGPSPREWPDAVRIAPGDFAGE